MQIELCSSRSDWKKFEHLPEQLFGKDDFFVPCIPGEVIGLSEKKHPFYQHGQIKAYLATINGQLVGRIAAIFNQTHQEFHKDQVGFFGFFDFIDDLTVANALYEKAKKDLIMWGCKVMRGPFCPTQNDPLGVLVTRGNHPPAMMMAYNPSYYQEIYEGLNFKKAKDLLTFYESDFKQAFNKTSKLSSHMKKKYEVSVRSLDMNNLKSECVVIQSLFNSTLAKEWNFMPMGDADMSEFAKNLKHIVHPDLIAIAEVKGEPVGFIMTFPDINKLMIKVRSTPRWLRFLHFFLLLKFSKINAVRVAVLGVKESYKHLGIAAILYYEIYLRVFKYFNCGEIAWVQEDNKNMISAILKLGGMQEKVYRIYEQTLTSK